MLRVQVCTGDKTCVEMFAQIFGGYAKARSPRSNSKRQLWNWQLTNLQAQTFLAQILPYLQSEKKQQALVALEFPFSTQGKHLTPDQQTQRKVLAGEIRAINQRVTVQ